MTIRTSLWAGLAAAGLMSTFTSVASASSHREAPAISNDPAADNTDLWAWTSPSHDLLYIVASYIPLEEPSGGPNFNRFSDDVLYEVHVTRGDANLDDAVTYQIKFTTPKVMNVDPADLAAPPGGGKEFFGQLGAAAGGGWQAQTYSVTKVENGTKTVLVAAAPVAPPNAGPRTDSFVGGGVPYDFDFVKTFNTSLGAGEGRSFAGPTDDGFYVDLGGIFDLANLRLATSGTNPDLVAQDGVAGFNVHTISLEIPTNKLTANGQPPTAGASDAQTLGIWASASRRKVSVLRADGTADSYGPWVQVSRLGVPLVNEALIGLQDKDKYNRTQPTDDVANFASYFLNPVLVRDAETVGIYDLYGVSDASGFESGRTDILDAINLTNFPTAGAHQIPIAPHQTGDVLRVDLGIDSGFPNGRPIPGPTANTEQADVTDVLVWLILTGGGLGTPGCGGPAAGKVGDCVNHNDVNYPGEFPWLATPHQGRNDGHGKFAL